MEMPPEAITRPRQPAADPVCVDGTCTMSQEDLAIVIAYIDALTTYLLVQLLRCQDVTNGAL